MPVLYQLCRKFQTPKNCAGWTPETPMEDTAGIPPGAAFDIHKQIERQRAKQVAAPDKFAPQTGWRTSNRRSCSARTRSTAFPMPVSPEPILGSPVSDLWGKFFENPCFLLARCLQNLIFFAIETKRNGRLSKTSNLNYYEDPYLSSTESLLSCDASFFLNCADSVFREGCGRDDYHSWLWWRCKWLD
jgi:hypothetical protein